MPALKNRPARKRKPKVSSSGGGFLKKPSAEKVAASQEKGMRFEKSARPTTAENLEERFDAGKNVLDYFDLTRIKLGNRG